MNDLPFARLTSLELPDLFETGFVKLKNIISDSKLPNHMKQLIAYLQQTMPGSNYYVENEFNSYTKNLNTKFFSISFEYSKLKTVIVKKQ